MYYYLIVKKIGSGVMQSYRLFLWAINCFKIF